ncbi:30S ribosomal protein S16-1, chloroplastic [Linum grandiflorum]
MAVKIRFARHGCTHRPFYRIVVANSQSPRDGRFIQIIGFYDPLAAKDDTKKMGLNYDRAKYWLSVGAQPSDTVRRILMQAGLIEPPPMVVMARKDGKKDEA